MANAAAHDRMSNGHLHAQMYVQHSHDYMQHNDHELGNGALELPHVQHHHHVLQQYGPGRTIEQPADVPDLVPARAHANIMRPLHDNHACILAIARAVPPHTLLQQSYADFYFNVTNCQHLTQLKLKMQRICERSGVETRHSIMTEEFLKDHPELYTPGKPSLEERHRVLEEEVPKLAAEAAAAAIGEWGRPAHHITHLVVVTLSGVAMPGADVRLVQLLGLRPSVRRVMLYMLGCYAGVTALRVAKDLAENNPGSRVLICCSELSATTFRAPQESSPYNLVSSALFGDGAVALIVGAHPLLHPTPSPTPTHFNFSMPTNSSTTTNCGIATNSSTTTNSSMPTKSGIFPTNSSMPTNSSTTNSSMPTKSGIFATISSMPTNSSMPSSYTTPLPPPRCTSSSNGTFLILSPPHTHENHHIDHPHNTSIGRQQSVMPLTPNGMPTQTFPAATNPTPDVSLHTNLTIEHPIYEIHTAIETIIPHTESIIQGNMKVEGLEFYLDRALPSIVSDHVATFCKDLIKDIPSEVPLSLQEVFWAVHPGGPAVLDAVERAAKLDNHQLQASRDILSKYGNVSASSVLFVLDELRKSTSMQLSPKWGIAIAFGPGITFEGVLLQRVVA